MNKFFFIAVNYNGLEFTKQYIESIKNIAKDTTDSVQIVIVDNNSNKSDKTSLTELKKNVADLEVILLSENIGYFPALNKGIEFVKKDKDTMMIIGNNDLTFSMDFITNLKKIDYSTDSLVIAPNIITKQGRQQNPHVVKEVSGIEKIKSEIYYSNYYIGQVLRFFNQSIKKVLNKKPQLKNSYGQMKIKRGIGACYILTPNFFNHFALLDDRVFMWGEEALLSNQIESVGGFTLYDPTIKIIHHESASVSNIQSKKKYHMIKKSYKVYKKYL